MISDIERGNDGHLLCRMMTVGKRKSVGVDKCEAIDLRILLSPEVAESQALMSDLGSLILIVLLHVLQQTACS
jgi:hypothetical protein